MQVWFGALLRRQLITIQVAPHSDGLELHEIRQAAEKKVSDELTDET